MLIFAVWEWRKWARIVNNLMCEFKDRREVWRSLSSAVWYYVWFDIVCNLISFVIWYCQQTADDMICSLILFTVWYHVQLDIVCNLISSAVWYCQQIWYHHKLSLADIYHTVRLAWIQRIQIKRSRCCWC